MPGTVAPRRACPQRRRRNWPEIVGTGPDPLVDGVVRWRRIDLKRLIKERFGVDYHERYVGKLLKELGFSHMSARPRHPGAGRSCHGRVQKNFARTLSAHLADLPQGTPVEIWFQDEARIGQKNGIVRQWARRGTRPRQPADQRYKSAYLFGAICPARGTGAALALPFAETPRPCSFISTRSAAMWRRESMPSCCSTAPDGTQPTSSTCRPT